MQGGLGQGSIVAFETLRRLVQCDLKGYTGCEEQPGAPAKIRHARQLLLVRPDLSPPCLGSDKWLRAGDV